MSYVKRMIRKLITLMLMIGFLICFDAQGQESFRHYSSEQGFSGAAFKKMAQDSLGFLWISSGTGLYRFDGYNFTNFALSVPGQINPLQSTGLNDLLTVDPSGKVWFAINDYLSRYDRDKNLFVPFITVPRNGKIESMYFENENILWLSSSGEGLTCIDVPTGKEITYLNKKQEEQEFIADNTFQCILDKGNYLLLGSRNGVWLFDKEGKFFFRPPCNGDDCRTVSSGNIKKIFPHNGFEWFWIGHELIKVNNAYVIVQRFDLDNIQKRFDYEDRFVDLGIMGLTEDQSGNFWIASQGLGLTFYDPQQNLLKNFRNDKNDENSLPSDVLTEVMIDRDQNVWVTTVTKGIAQLIKRSLVFYNYLEGISTTGIGVLDKGGTEQLIVGTNGRNLWKSNFKRENISKLIFEPIEMQPPVPGFENIIELAIGRKDIWIGSMQAGIAGLSFRSDGKIDPGPHLFQHDGQNENSILDNFITSFWEDGNGYLWTGTYNGGLSIMDPENYGKPGSVFNYSHIEKDTNSLGNNGVRSFLIEEDGSILLTTFGGIDRIRHTRNGYAGLEFEHLLSNVYCSKIRRTEDGTYYVTTKIGLYKGVRKGENYNFTKLSILGDRNLTYLQEDRLGRLWIMSFEGLFFYDPKKEFVLRFGKEDGLPSSRSVMAGSVSQTKEGIMIFGNAEGLTIFDPISLKINETRPKPVITSLSINNIISSRQKLEGIPLTESINTLKKLTLNHTHRILSVEFSAMDYTAPEKNLYKYKLEGFDENWITTDWKNRTANYTNLRPGNYILKIRASNSDEVWSENETRLAISVLPPPWKSWWAYLLYTITFIALLFLARRNIIQRERLASRLKLDHLELEKTQEVDRTRSAFFTNISHEFRTPLTLILGPAQNMIDQLKKNKSLKANEAIPQLDLILVNANRLLRLINQVLDLSKLESGGLKKDFTEEDIISFLKSVIGNFTLLSVQKRIRLNSQFADHSVIARFDKDKIEKIVSNLIFNAMKFTPENGNILVTEGIKEGKQAGTSMLRIEVRDSGVGIPEDQIERIFERFFQVKEGDNQNAGAGIGLALSKELAEFLGGSISVVSLPHMGSTFILLLPLEIIEMKENLDIHGTMPLTSVMPGEINDENTDGYREDLKPLLLIVEDHIDLRKFICTCLGDEYEYLEAGDGKDGYQLAVEQLPSLIVSDVMMPEMDGVEMCNKIKQDHRSNHIPIILLTAKAGDENKVSGLDKGADDYIIKPFNKEELVLKIRNQILAQKRMQEKIRLEILSGSTPVNAVSADEKFLSRIKEIIELRMSDEKLGVESLAGEIGLSRVQLYRKVNALTGISVNDFIRKLRLQKAAQLIAKNWGNVAEVAYEVGFSNPSYFSKCFKDHFGVLPSQFFSPKV